jgi:hypothetical protein
MRRGGQYWMFWVNNWTQQSHTLYYLYELRLSHHVNLFGSSVGPKSYLISFFLSSSSSFTLLLQKFQFAFSSLLLYFLDIFFPLFTFFEYFYFNSCLLLFFFFSNFTFPFFLFIFSNSIIFSSVFSHFWSILTLDHGIKKAKHPCGLCFYHSHQTYYCKHFGIIVTCLK